MKAVVALTPYSSQDTRGGTRSRKFGRITYTYAFIWSEEEYQEQQITIEFCRILLSSFGTHYINYTIIWYYDVNNLKKK